MAISHELRTDSMLGDTPPDSPPASASAAACPAARNRYFALESVCAARTLRGEHSGCRPNRSDEGPTAASGPRVTNCVTGGSRLRRPPPDVAERRRQENPEAVGGMRHPLLPVQRLLGFAKSEAVIHALVSKHLDNFPDSIQRGTASVGAAEDDAGPPLAYSPRSKHALGRLWGARSLEGVDADLFRTEVRGDPLQAWAVRANDPELEAVSWLATGGLAGVLALPGDPSIFLRVPGPEALTEQRELNLIGEVCRRRRWLAPS